MLWLGLLGDTEGNVGLLVFSINEILYHSSIPDPWRKLGLLEKAGLMVFVVDVVLEMNTRYYLYLGVFHSPLCMTLIPGPKFFTFPVPHSHRLD